MINRVAIITILSLTSISCNLYNALTLSNESDQSIRLQFQGAFQLDSTKIFLSPKKDTVIRTVSFKKGQSDDDLDLRSIIISSADSQFNILRFSNSYLLYRNWHFKLPFSISDSLAKRALTDSLANYSYYHFVQELYNSSRHKECLDAIIGILKPLLIRLAESKRKFYDGQGGVYQMDPQYQLDVIAETRGFYLLGFLSATKTGLPDRARYYLEKLRSDYPNYYEFLMNYDQEVTKMVLANQSLPPNRH
jgi:hypothetical protein